MRQHGLKETVYTVRYHVGLEEAACAVRVGHRSTRDNTPDTNMLLRDHFARPAASNRLDEIWYRAMQRAGVV